MADMVTYRYYANPNHMYDELAKLEGETVNLVDPDENIIGQVIIGPITELHCDRFVDLHVDPDTRVIGA